jgi:hypothetical protein
MIPMETISFMGDIYDIRRGWSGAYFFLAMASTYMAGIAQGWVR